MKTKINEIFSSIQGEGPVVGYKQLFIRFCNCNLNCTYCDTEFKNGIEYTPKELYNKINSQYNLSTFHSIALTGGEPLLENNFLVEFLPALKRKTKVYLETNGTLYEALPKIQKYIDIISADIKLKSASGQYTFDLHNKFFSQTKGTETFAKIVFDSNITANEIEECIYLGKKYDIELILQPKTAGEKITVNSEFCYEILEKFTQKYNKVRLIPQVHKFINIK